MASCFIPIPVSITNTFLGADQEIMNVAYYNQITPLPVSANMMFTCRFFKPRDIYNVSSKTPASYYTPEEFAEANRRPLIVHFAGGAPYQPWREEGTYYMDEDADAWFALCEKLYPNGKYDLNKLRAIQKESPKRKRFFNTAGKLPGLYCWLKGRYRNIKLIPKKVRTKQMRRNAQPAHS